MDVKNEVKEAYTKIAETGRSCCGNGCGSLVDYSGIDGWIPDADFGLGCGLPTMNAGISKGNTVVDLGSGAGNDAFVARRIVGETGLVIGIDMTTAMIEKASGNCKKLGYENVEFRMGEIENLPVDDDCADVVISNCVLNLVPDKKKAFSEIFRILKPGGRFSISDIVMDGEVSGETRQIIGLYAACIGGAVSTKEYLDIIKDTGFENISLASENTIHVTEELAKDFISSDDFKKISSMASGTLTVKSITVTGFKQV